MAAFWVKACVEHRAGALFERWCSNYSESVFSSKFSLLTMMGWSFWNSIHCTDCWELGPRSSFLLCSLDNRCQV